MGNFLAMERYVGPNITIRHIDFGYDPDKPSAGLLPSPAPRVTLDLTVTQAWSDFLQRKARRQVRRGNGHHLPAEECRLRSLWNDFRVGYGISLHVSMFLNNTGKNAVIGRNVDVGPVSPRKTTTGARPLMECAPHGRVPDSKSDGLVVGPGSRVTGRRKDRAFR